MEQRRKIPVLMGVCDGTEDFDLIGLHTLKTICKSINFTSRGHYRDDGLTVLKSASGSQSECTKNDSLKHFESMT